MARVGWPTGSMQLRLDFVLIIQRRKRMDRRHVLLGLAGMTLTSAALAQSGTSAAGAGGSAAMGQAEQQWMQQTMMVGSVAMKSSELAVQNARDEDVKQFAQFEVDEQKGLAEVLR